jgi:hypothetical protein
VFKQGKDLVFDEENRVLVKARGFLAVFYKKGL